MAKPKILIVEDNIIESEMILALCSEFEATQAYDGIAGAKLLPNADCVCVDGNFPYNGIFYDDLIKSGKPFIIYSAGTDFKGCGEIASVLKPFASDLVIVLEKMRKSL